MSWFVPKVWFFFAAGVPDAFDRINLMKSMIGSITVTNVVKNKELGFRANERNIAYLCIFKIGFSLMGYVPRVSGVSFFGDRIHYVANQ